MARESRTKSPRTKRRVGVARVRKLPSRDVPRPVEKMLWARAAGRCECDGCNAPLYKSEVSQESVPVGQNAHIYAFNEGGARGGLDDKGKIHDPSNLILVCYPCHRRIDGHLRERYTPELLRGWKHDHEARVARVTAIAPSRQSHRLHYGAPVGEQPAQFRPEETTAAMFPDRFPAEDHPISVGLTNSVLRDGSSRYWDIEVPHLSDAFEQKIRRRVHRADEGAIRHLSVFALAPQPLLIGLGVLLGDIVPADVYQLRREPPGWGFDLEVEPLELGVEEPNDTDGPPALVVGLSASVTRDRITKVLGSNASVWHVTVPGPHNDLIASREHLRAFRTVMRKVLNRIKKAHGQGTLLHVFPVMPVSTSVELGRVRMPKADMPWLIYDQISPHGFVPAVHVNEGSLSAFRGATK